MIEFIADRADFIIAGVQTALTLDMLPTIWSQFRARASTVPLTSSVPTAVGLAVLGLVFFSTGLFIATGTVLVGSMMWTVVAAQRVGYNRDDGSASPTPDADPQLRTDHTRVRGVGSQPYEIFKKDGQYCCVHFARVGWCWHDSSPPRRDERQATGVGLAGHNEGASSALEDIPNLVHDPSAATLDIDGDRTEVEEE